MNKKLGSIALLLGIIFSCNDEQSTEKRILCISPAGSYAKEQDGVYYLPKPGDPLVFEGKAENWENGQVVVPNNGILEISGIWEMEANALNEGLDIYVGGKFKKRILRSACSPTQATRCTNCLAFIINEKNISVNGGEKFYFKKFGKYFDGITKVVICFKKDDPGSGGALSAPSGGLGSHGEGNSSIGSRD